MIEKLHLENVGPEDKLSLNLSPRINIFTGDNGLGKSFLLDIMWWALTRCWPQNINHHIKSGYTARPIDIKKEAKIKFTLLGKTKKLKEYSATYNRLEESWIGLPGRPINPGLVIYTMSDGSYALWDPERNYWTKNTEFSENKRPQAYVYSQSEIWEGVDDKKNDTYFSGLLADWQIWQTGNTEQFKQLQEVLKALSTEDELLEIGELSPFKLDDSRLYPTIKMPYQHKVLLPHTSSGMKRIITLAYFLVYAWKRHCESAKITGSEPTEQITLLIDEMEAHLHPKWQRKIVPALLNVMNSLSINAKIQLITATHSPLIMSSLEPIFDENQDSWFDLDLNKNKIKIQKREFEKLGTVNDWLESEAFDLKTSRAADYEKIIIEAEEAISLKNQNKISKKKINDIYQRLLKALSPEDDFLFYWRAICVKKGLLDVKYSSSK